MKNDIYNLFTFYNLYGVLILYYCCVLIFYIDIKINRSDNSNIIQL